MKFVLVLPALGLATAGLLTGCGKPQDPAPTQAPQVAQQQVDAADTIYTGGDIVTVNDRQPGAEALAVKAGKIVAVGSRAEVERAHKGGGTTVIDLGGKALLPAFLDAHSHDISPLTVANQVNLYAPPAGPGKDPASIVAELVKFRDAHKIPKGEVIQAYGHDENVMPSGHPLNRDDLDKALPDNPVLVGHVALIGADQPVTPLEALKAQTINVALPHGEQASKGPLDVGKRTDLVVLDQNPLKVDVMKIKDIQVVESYRDGKSIHKCGE